ncbi:MAG: amino acid ABC transporter substrate-binding protein [Clostridia bacterium]|nr:amino acid ABC transporter substrate-binding protein [Clostridia bacterium]
MKNKLKSLVAIFLLFVLSFTFSSCSFIKNGDFNSNEPTIKIGLSAPLTGAKSEYGIAAKNSAQLAVDEINAMGGINGIKLELMVRNDFNNKIIARYNYKKLYKSGMQISLGTVTNRPALSFNKQAAKDNVFILTPSASTDEILQYENTYQMCINDSNTGSNLARVIDFEYGSKQTKVGIFYKSDDSKFAGIKDAFFRSLAPSFETPIVASFTSLTSLNFSLQANKLKDCDVILILADKDSAARFMKNGRNIVNPDAVYYGTEDMFGIDSVKNFDISSIPQKVCFLSAYNYNSTEGASKIYADKYKSVYGDDAPLNEYGASAYDSVYAIYAAIKNATNEGYKLDETTSPAEFCKALKSSFDGDFKFFGICEENEWGITWSADGRVNKRTFWYYVK